MKPDKVMRLRGIWRMRGMWRGVWRGLALLIGMLLLSGCVTLRDPEASQEYSADAVGYLEAGHSLGQSFVSRRAGLNGVDLWLRQVQPPDDPQAVLTVELYDAPTGSGGAFVAGQPRHTQRLSAAAIARSFPLALRFPTQDTPPEHVFYLRLTVSDGRYELLGRNEDAYPHGALWLDDRPQATDAAFRSSYNYDLAAVLGDLLAVVGRAWLAIPLLLTLWLPGRLLLTWIEADLPLDWGQRAALSAGLSLALIPVLLLWSGTLGLHAGPVSAWALALLLAGLLAWRLVRARRRHAWHTTSLWRRLDGLDLALLLIFCATLALRLMMVRDLAAPVWVDSTHHLLITRLIVEQGAFPSTYAPFAEALYANYHPGFMAVTAVFTWLSGLGLAAAMLLLGQVLNALSVLFVYLLAVGLTGRRLAGVLAGLLVGLYSPMPAYYAGWGRYTQLAGLIVLPAAIYLILWAPRPAGWRRTLPLAGLTCAGLFLVHYRVAAFMALLLVAVLVKEVIWQLPQRPLWETLLRIVLPVSAAALIAIALSLPWFRLLLETEIAPVVSSGPGRPQPLNEITWGYFTPAAGRLVLALGLGGLVVSIFKARPFGLLLALWSGLLMMSANQGSIPIPFVGNINRGSVEITLFVPLCIAGGWLAAWLLGWLYRRLPPLLRPAYVAGMVTTLAIISLYAAQLLLPVLNPATLLVRQADLDGLAWAESNLPADAVTLVNPFLWGYGHYAGQDGGYYLSGLAGRASMPPPVLYADGTPDYVRRIHAISQQTLENGKDPQAIYALMQREGIGYIFIGARGGTLSPKLLRESGLFETLYAHDGVYILRAR